MKTRPAESVHLVYQYLLLEGSRAEYYVIGMKVAFSKNEKRIAPFTHSPLAF